MVKPDKCLVALEKLVAPQHRTFHPASGLERWLIGVAAAPADVGFATQWVVERPAPSPAQLVFQRGYFVAVPALLGLLRVVAGNAGQHGERGSDSGPVHWHGQALEHLPDRLGAGGTTGVVDLV